MRWWIVLIPVILWVNSCCATLQVFITPNLSDRVAHDENGGRTYTAFTIRGGVLSFDPVFIGYSDDSTGQTLGGAASIGSVSIFVPFNQSGHFTIFAHANDFGGIVFATPMQLTVMKLVISPQEITVCVGDTSGPIFASLDPITNGEAGNIAADPALSTSTNSVYLFPDGTNQFTVTGNSAGTELIVTITQDVAPHCSAILKVNVIDATVTATPDVVCVGDEVTLSAMTTPEDTIVTWYDGASQIGSGKSVTHSFSSAGVKSVTCKIAYHDHTCEKIVSVSVVQLDKIQYLSKAGEFKDGPANACSGEFILVRALPFPADVAFPPGHPVWSDGTTGELATMVVGFGPQAISATCGNTVTLDVVGIEIAKIKYIKDGVEEEVPDPLFVCKGDMVEFKAVASPEGESFPEGDPVWGGTSGAEGAGETISVTFDKPGSQTVTATCGSTVTVNVVAVEVGGIQYLDVTTNTFVTVENTLTVRGDQPVQFRAIPKPATAQFPLGHPVWGGAATGNGNDPPIIVTFPGNGTYEVSATCGNEVKITVNVVSFAITQVSDHVVPHATHNAVRYAWAPADEPPTSVQMDVYFANSPNSPIRSISGLPTTIGPNGFAEFRWNGLDQTGAPLPGKGSVAYRIKLSAKWGNEQSISEASFFVRTKKFKVAMIDNPSPKNEVVIAGADKETVVKFLSLKVSLDGNPDISLPFEVSDLGASESVNAVGLLVRTPYLFYVTPAAPYDIRYKVVLEQDPGVGGRNTITDGVLNPWDMDPVKAGRQTKATYEFGLDGNTQRNPTEVFEP